MYVFMPVVMSVIMPVIIPVIIFYWYYSKKINNAKCIECVVARYNESVSWIYKPEYYGINKFLIYNKGTPLPPLSNNVKEIRLPNIGKCDQTFLYHIVTNYDNLADVTMFVSGRGDDPRKGPKILKTMKLVNKTKNSVFIGSHINIPKDIWNFSLDEWRSTNPENNINEGNITKLDYAKIRPFGPWFNSFWPNKKVNLVATLSIFAVHKDHILQNSIEYYKLLLEELNYSINPEAGHYMERSWVMVFNPIPKKCLYYE
jgi:hypothetical protein